MKKPKITTADVLARLAPTDLHLADDDDLIAGVERAIEAIGDPQQALAYAIAYRSGLRAQSSERVPAAEPVPVPPQQPSRQAVFDEARLAGEQAGSDAERSRIRAILTSPEAAERSEAARHLAFGTSMTPAEAKAFLQTVAPATAAEAIQRLPGTVARACHAPGGLVAFDATLGAIAPIEAGHAPAGASIGFDPAPDPFANAKADPKTAAAASWKKVTGQLNAEAEHSVQA